MAPPRRTSQSSQGDIPDIAKAIEAIILPRGNILPRDTDIATCQNRDLTHDNKKNFTKKN